MSGILRPLYFSRYTMADILRTTKRAISQQMYSARSCRLLHANLLVAKHPPKDAPWPFYEPFLISQRATRHPVPGFRKRARRAGPKPELGLNMTYRNRQGPDGSLHCNRRISFQEGHLYAAMRRRCSIRTSDGGSVASAASFSALAATARSALISFSSWARAATAASASWTVYTFWNVYIYIYYVHIYI